MSDPRPNIWRLQAHFDTAGLIEALKNDDPVIRRRAAAALRTLGAVEAVAPLQAALKTEKDPDARNSISAALDYLLPEQVLTVPTLIAQLRSSQPEMIINAARALGELKDKTAVEELVLVFNNALLPGKVRLAAAEALIKLESAPAVVTLLAALRSKNWYVRRSAAAVLGQIKADWAVEALALRLDDENEIVRRTARAALRHIHTPEAFKALELNAPMGAQSAVNWQPTAQPAGQPPLPETGPDAPPQNAAASENSVTQSFAGDTVAASSSLSSPASASPSAQASPAGQPSSSRPQTQSEPSVPSSDTPLVR